MSTTTSTDLPPDIDLYTLLSIPPTSTESEIRRAYRKTSRLYHPDKVTPTPETLSKFQLLQQAIEILTDAVERSKYDAGREAALRRKAEREAMDEKRRRMVGDLERREQGQGQGQEGNGSGVGGTKRAWSQRELEIKRIREENLRRREEKVRRKVEEVEEVRRQAEEKSEEEVGGEVERSVKVRWVKEGDGLDVDGDSLTEMFSAGDVETVVVLKDKKRKVEGKDKKVVMGTAVLVFKSLSAARKAVAKGKTDELDSIAWAMEKGNGTEDTTGTPTKDGET